MKPTGVGKDGAVPAHHGVEPSQLPDNIVAGAQVQVVGVAQLDLTPDLPQVVGGQPPLDGPLGAYVHKDGGLYLSAVCAGKTAPAGQSLCFQYLKHRS